jgi:sarcosine oxidase subunit beta
VVRSNYLYPESAAFFDHSLKLYEGLSSTLNFNMMLSQRGQLTLCHSEHDLEMMRRTVNAIQLNGIDTEELSVADIQKRVPLLNVNGRHPVLGGCIQPRAGIARHDAVAWGFARGASAAGVDIIENCGVEGFETQGDKIIAVNTTRGKIKAGKVGTAVAGHSSDVARLLGLRLPITSMALQAMVTEPIKPAMDTAVISPLVHMYISQSDRGEMVIGGGADAYTSYAQRGGIPVIEANIAAVLELFPKLSRLKLMRQWAGIVDITPDTSPIIGKTPFDNFYINGGWGTGGFKAIPAGGDTFASTIANDKAHPLVETFGLERFSNGRLVDESAASGVAH